MAHDNNEEAVRKIGTYFIDNFLSFLLLHYKDKNCVLATLPKCQFPSQSFCCNFFLFFCGNRYPLLSEQTFLVLMKPATERWRSLIFRKQARQLVKMERMKIHVRHIFPSCHFSFQMIKKHTKKAASDKIFEQNTFSWNHSNPKSFRNIFVSSFEVYKDERRKRTWNSEKEKKKLFENIFFNKIQLKTISGNL